MLQAWRKRRASDATFDALLAAENNKVMQQLADLHAKKDEKDRDFCCAIAQVGPARVKEFRGNKQHRIAEDVGS